MEMLRVWLLVLLIFVVVVHSAKKVPEKFLGSWAVKESENFEEYLIARGYNWLMRQLILYSPVTKIFEKNIKTLDAYNALILTPTRDARWYNWKLGEPFVGVYVDDDRHRITFDYDIKTDRLSEIHKNLDKPTEPIDSILYEVNDQNRLVMTVEINGIVGRRYYDKKEK